MEKYLRICLAIHDPEIMVRLRKYCNDNFVIRSYLIEKLIKDFLDKNEAQNKRQKQMSYKDRGSKPDV